MRLTGPALILTLCLAGCAASIPERPATGMIPPGDYVQRLPGGKVGSPHQYRAHVPRLEGRAPVVVALHGAFSSGRALEKRSGLDALADDHGFIAIYPDGFGFLGMFRHWNAGHCCGRAAKLGLDHIGYIDAVIDDALERLPADPTRVYIVGESNGGMLAYRYAAARPQRLAAAGIVIGTLGSADVTPGSEPPAGSLEPPPPSLPVPIVIIHGLDDPIVPFNGGSTKRAPDTTWVSVPQSAAYWIRENGAATDPKVTTAHGNRITRRRWAGGEGGQDVLLYEIGGWDHRWPGARDLQQLPASDARRDFDAATVIWSFFDGRKRAQP